MEEECRHIFFHTQGNNGYLEERHKELHMEQLGAVWNSKPTPNSPQTKELTKAGRIEPWFSHSYVECMRHPNFTKFLDHQVTPHTSTGRCFKTKAVTFKKLKILPRIKVQLEAHRTLKSRLVKHLDLAAHLKY